MKFPPKVERWRVDVKETLTRLLNARTARKSLIQASGLSYDDVVEVVLAIIQKESSGDPLAVGDAGKSVGLMQIQHATAINEGYVGTLEGLHDPIVNIYYGFSYLLTQLSVTRDINRAILAYNAGHFHRPGEHHNLIYLESVLSFLGKKKTDTASSQSSSASDSSTSSSGGDVKPEKDKIGIPIPRKKLLRDDEAAMNRAFSERKYVLGGPVAIVTALGVALTLLAAYFHNC